MCSVAVAIIGMGKIARDQHIPAVAACTDFDFVAAIDIAGAAGDVPCFPTIGDLLRDGPAVQAVAICSPPQVRAALARQAIAAGLHVLLEKPPAATVGDCKALLRLSETRGTTIFAAWHSRFAPMVKVARDWLIGRRIVGGRVVWHENVRQWHPGQKWLWQPGGLGVFDSGINAFSILTRLCPDTVTVGKVRFLVPSGGQSPIAAAMTLGIDGATVTADFDFRSEGQPTWLIELETESGETLHLAEGGAGLHINGDRLQGGTAESEYHGVYRRFAQLFVARSSELDVAPLQLAADAFLIAHTELTDPFDP